MNALNLVPQWDEYEVDGTFLRKCCSSRRKGAYCVINQRYWLLFGIAIAMAVHSFVVGRFLGSSFFMLLFFWGWVAAAAYRGRLESARAMAITMVVLLVTVAAAMAFFRSEFHNELAYYAFALYPAIVSWICVYLYVRHLMQKDGEAGPAAAQVAARTLKLRDPVT